VEKLESILAKIISDFKVDGSLLIIFVNHKRMMELNYRFKGRKRPTDVLAFNLAEKESNNYIEGEIYVDLQTAAEQAKEYDVDYIEESARLCIHGLLHLLGFDDLNSTDKKNMWEKQEKYISDFFDKRIIDGNKR
jgi:probable rRNA maturation factor